MNDLKTEKKLMKNFERSKRFYEQLEKRDGRIITIEVVCFIDEYGLYINGVETQYFTKKCKFKHEVYLMLVFLLGKDIVKELYKYKKIVIARNQYSEIETRLIEERIL